MTTRTAESRADLWVIDLAVAACEVSRLADHCSEDEIARANRFTSTTHRDRYVTCRGRAREVLAGYAGCSPAALRFAVTTRGKPYLPDYTEGLYFNVSHSSDLAVIAVSRDYEIGVDLEIPRPVEPAVAQAFFSAAEVAALAALPEDRWLDGFYRCWTRKEAFVKALGAGLNHPLDSFTVPLDDGEQPMPLVTADERLVAWQAWRLLPFRVAGRAIGAVCIACANHPVALNRLQR